MSSTQPPYYASTFGDPTQHPHGSAPVGTQMGGGVPSTSDIQTGPAPTTAGPHQSDMANKVDPRVDSDLNNRAQYAPGTTVAGNVHPQTTQDASYNSSSNAGPHQSSMMNKLDPRVDSLSGDMSTKTTNQTGSGATHTYTDTSGTVPQSGYQAYHPGTHDPRLHNDPAVAGAHTTGPGYASTGVQYEEAQPSNSTMGSKPTTKGEGIGHGIKSAIAGIHGTGESLRGNLNAAFDKAFGDDEGAAKNAAIAQRGEQEISSGEFQRNRHHR